MHRDGNSDGRRLLSAVSGELTRQGVIAHLRGLVAVAGYVTGDGYQHVIATIADGEIHEIYWQGAGAPSQGVLMTLPGVVSVAGYATGDGYQHAIAATDSGDIHEIYWPGGGSVSQGVLDTLPGVVSVAGYVTGDGFQHVIAATGGGDIHEIYWQGGGSVSQGVLDTLPGVDRVAAYVTADGVPARDRLRRFRPDPRDLLAERRPNHRKQFSTGIPDRTSPSSWAWPGISPRTTVSST